LIASNPIYKGASVISRVLSMLLFCAYVPVFWSEGPGIVTTILGICFVPLMCVWFPEALGEATPAEVRESPPSLVWLFGWFTLLLPLIAKLVGFLYTYR
jgi:small-conductance mechanosensitive channel